MGARSFIVRGKGNPESFHRFVCFLVYLFVSLNSVTVNPLTTTPLLRLRFFFLERVESPVISLVLQPLKPYGPTGPLLLEFIPVSVA